jgi:hypothetical protein
MMRYRALERIRKLLALAREGSGATEEEARTAAMQAVRMMSEHGIGPGDGPQSSTVDLDQVAALALRVVSLERLLADREAERLKEIREDNQRWRLVVEDVRQEERAALLKRVKKATGTAARKEREGLARSGGRARAVKLDPERRVEIARAGALARWARWRERHQSFELKQDGSATPKAS